MEAILLSDEEIKRQKKGMGSKIHSLIQENLIVQIAFKYFDIYRAIPELSLDFDGTEKVPDLCIYKRNTIDVKEEEIRMKKLPLCVVEILSPKQVLSDLIKKSQIYFDYNIPSYWLVVPELESVYVYTAKNEREVFTVKDILKDTILDIELDLSKIF